MHLSSRLFPLALVLLSLLLYLHPCSAASKKALDSRGLPSDVPYIQCQVCAHVARSAVRAVNDLPADRHLDTVKVLDLVETLCDPDQKPARWMKKIDLVEAGPVLRVAEQEGQQACKRECRTVASACRRALDSVETELAERLYALRKAAELKDADVEDWLCAPRGGVSGACRDDPPPVPADRQPGPAFEPKSEKDVNMENLMEEIRAANPGNDMGLNMMQPGQDGMGMDDDEGDDDDDKDDEDDEREGDAEELGGAEENDTGKADGANDASLSFEDVGEVSNAQTAGANVGDESTNDEL